MKRLLVITSLTWIITISFAQIPYGNNPEVGKFVQSGDAKIYYEVYGSGEPLLLLHGGYYGYISEYYMYLPTLIENFKVIAVATRGHGKSEIGHQEMSYRLWAKDALNVLKQEGIDSALVMGFSDGGITGAVFAHDYPTFTKKLVFMGGGLNAHHSRLESLQGLSTMAGENELKNIPPFLKERMNIMPEPERFAEWVDMMKVAWMEPIILSNEETSAISCPVLIVLGDRDNYTIPEGAVDVYNRIPNAQLLIWPNADHVNLIFNPTMFNGVIMPFLKPE
ncbi:MAG: alpha/beta hydrolase [Salinivirgaceae bacterium]|jgi:pimeloyl-ACP methyl ester carboxylesterase|nr:alpha/beta hydrolase [Salinivirgaceae bacterium]